MTNTQKATQALATFAAFQAANAGCTFGVAVTTRAARGAGVLSTVTLRETAFRAGVNPQAVFARHLAAAFTNGAVSATLFAFNAAGAVVASLNVLHRAR